MKRDAAPACRDDFLLLLEDRRRRATAEIEALKARSSNAKYQQADPDTVAEYYRIHFRSALRQPEHLEKVIESLRASFTQAGILKAREIEDRLVEETWLASEYNLLPSLEQLRIPTLVIHGEHDLIPVECAAHVAQAIPGARLSLLRECGHFSYLECPEAVRKEIDDFFHGA